ncbi:growth hormone releasing hormone, isoform CRA_c, partial [Rattus norvegicus]
MGILGSGHHWCSRSAFLVADLSWSRLPARLDPTTAQ